MAKVDKAVIRQTVGAAPKVLQLDHSLDRHPKSLSGRQRQRGDRARHRYRLHALHLPQVAHSQSSTDAFDALAAGTLILSGAQLRDFGLPLPPLPPESAIVVGMRAVP